MEEKKKQILEILYQQLQLLAEKIEEADERQLGSMLCDFRHIAKTIITNHPTEEQKKEIFRMLNNQIKMLSEKKSVDLSDSMDDLANFIFQFLYMFCDH